MAKSGIMWARQEARDVRGRLLSDAIEIQQAEGFDGAIFIDDRMKVESVLNQPPSAHVITSMRRSRLQGG